VDAVLGLVAALVAIFLASYAAILNRAARGVGGVTARSRLIIYLSVTAGLVAVFAIEGGLRSSGASIGTTDLVGASGPIPVSGLACAGSAPARLRLMVTLAALRDGDTLSFTRLQELIGLTPGNLITHLRKLEDAGYLRTAKTVNGGSPMTAVSLTPDGRKALDRYSVALRELLDAADAAARR
jgi:DNA-binding transcriptional ArsR family regulator